MGTHNEWISLLTALIGGGVISAVLTAVFNRKKSSAEIKSIEAETDMRIVNVVSEQNAELRQEVSELKRKLDSVEMAKEALKRSEENLQRRVHELESLVRDSKGFYDAMHCKVLFESNPIAIIIASIEEGRILVGNTSFCNWLGYTFGEIQQMTLRDITSPIDWEQEQDVRDRCISGETLQYTLRNGYKSKFSQEYSPASVTVRLMRDKGVPLHFVIFITPLAFGTTIRP